MKDLRAYLLIGLITALVVYLISPNLFGNRIEIIKSSDDIDQYSSQQIGYSKTFEKVKHSVVSIYTKKNKTRGNVYYIHPEFGLTKKEKEKVVGQGSGIIVTNSGHILTNFHVIAGSIGILTLDSEGKEYETKVIGYDPLTDLAVLKIDKKSKPIILGEISKVNVGDIALAIGNPLGVGETITFGIVSATDRELETNSYGYQRLIQTDAAINPGNSGGALVNINGQLIGVNVSIKTLSGGSDGIGFAIPVDVAENVLKEIITKGEVERGFIGVLAEFEYSGKGVLIKSVVPDSPSAKSGLSKDDIIRKIDGVTINSVKDIQKIIGKLKPGQIITISVIRGSKSKEIDIVVEKMRP